MVREILADIKSKFLDLLALFLIGRKILESKNREFDDEARFRVLVRAFLLILVFFLLIFLLELMVSIVVVISRKALIFAPGLISKSWINLIGVVLIGGVGIALYKLRQSFRIFYGLLEVAFALVYGWFAIDKATGPNGYLETVGVVGAVYLVVRGADNISSGWLAYVEGNYFGVKYLKKDSIDSNKKTAP